MLVDELVQTPLDFELHICGQQFRDQPPAFARLAEDFDGYIKTFGYVEDRAAYLALLDQADIVLSTALQDFQGLAVQEGIQAGCIPVVPDRLAYPEYVASGFRYQSLPDDPKSEARACAALLQALTQARCDRAQHGDTDIARLEWPALKETYEQLIDETWRRGAVHG